MIGGTLNIKHVRAHWDEILRSGHLDQAGHGDGLPDAPKARQLPTPEPAWPWRSASWAASAHAVHPGLAAKRGTAPPRACRPEQGRGAHALARAVFFNRLGEIRDRSFEQQRYRASGLNLVTAAVVFVNTVYLERAAHALRGNGHAVDDALLQYLSPLGWEHINLTGDYLWRSSAKIGAGKFRPLRPLQPA